MTLDSEGSRVSGRGGACEALICEIDWSDSPVGPMKSWPVSLRVLVQTMLNARHPMLLFWGPELIQFYNDAFLPSFGEGKHPGAMGQAGRECWSEVWPIVGAQIEAVMDSGTPTWQQEALVPIYRNGRIEDVFWTYGYSPAYDDDGNIGGTLIVCTEQTRGVLANRRLQLVARLAERIGSAERPRDIVSKAFASFEGLRVDIPFAVAFDREGNTAGAYGLTRSATKNVQRHAMASLDGTGSRSIALENPIETDLWPEPVSTAFVIPFLEGSIVFGVSPRLPFDEPYRNFLLQAVDSMQAAHDRVEAVIRRLRSERERRDLLMKAPVAAALLMGPDLVFELANPRFVEMVGREVLGKRYMDAFPEVEGTPVLEAVQHVYRSGKPFSTDEMHVALDRDGSGELRDAFFKFNLEPIRAPDGKVTGMMAIAVEITDMVTARQQQARAHAERAALVERLEEASRAKDEFLAMLGHELRNPLAPIITALELIKLREGASLSHEHVIIERQSKHLIRLVDDLLDVARIVGGKVDLKPERCDIRTVIENAIEIAESLIEERHQQLTVSVPQSLTWWGDPARLAQIVSNLLTNAARYTQPGGEIEVSVHGQDDEIHIRVSDNGEGIPVELLDRIFDAFVQGRREARRGQGGLGLGLTLTRNLVELHGGTVTASSEGYGKGSTFLVRLPAIAEPKQSAKPAPRTSESRKRILVVDDNRDAASVLCARLESAGHSVAIAHDGPSALEAFARHAPEVAILDIGLPVMDGYELARRIGEMQGGDRCRLIAVTGYAQPADRERSAAAGFQAHLVKPVSFERLSSTLSSQGASAESRRPSGV